ncbi:histidine phosphatase superfamily [Mrakia frigida]|uniref:histidine phosphatase family protein n=1 Tax=Mrakia frigida TaxID=29902 RepID=UPI003FCC1E9A
MAPLLVTIVRHGQSLDNTAGIWAGWKDAPLSELGLKQANAVGGYFKEVKIDAIFASPLLRARWTGEQIHQQNQTVPHPEITISPLLREEFFGDYEGKNLTGNPISHSLERDFAFPGGESLNDVGARADEAIDQFILPYILNTATSSEQQHVIVTAHGIFNSELVGAFLRRRASGEGTGWQPTGMTNTGWTRLEISINDPSHPSSSTVAGHPTPSDSNPSSIPSAAAPTLPTAHAGPKLDVKILLVNQTTHLDHLRSQMPAEDGTAVAAGGSVGKL